MNMLEQKVREIYNKFLKFPKKMIFTQVGAELYAATNTCHICERDICDPTEKFKDHCHLTGKFRRAAHNKCNLKYQILKFSLLYFTICRVTIVICLLKSCMVIGMNE